MISGQDTRNPASNTVFRVDRAGVHNTPWRNAIWLAMVSKLIIVNFSVYCPKMSKQPEFGGAIRAYVDDVYLFYVDVGDCFAKKT